MEARAETNAIIGPGNRRGANAATQAGLPALLEDACSGGEHLVAALLFDRKRSIRSLRR